MSGAGLIAKTGITTQTYAYDDQGRRIRKTTSSTQNLLYNGDDIYAEYGTSWTTPAAVYTYAGLDNPISRIQTTGAATYGQAVYYHQDGLGSVVATSNNQNTTTVTQRFDAWGKQLASTGTIPQFGYTGREADETGLTYYRARYYNPTIGRFTQRDPSGLAGGLNAYVYVENGPTNFVDPTGLVKAAPAVGGNQNSYSYFNGGNGSIYQSQQSLQSTNITGTSKYIQLACAGTCSGVLAGSGGASEMAGAVTSRSVGGVLGLTLSLSGDTQQDNGKTVYITYTRTNPKTGEVYSGRTSGRIDESIDAILARRASGQPILNKERFNPPVFDQAATSISPIRGREQQLIDYYGGAQSVGGTARNKINGISDWNPNRGSYMSQATELFGSLSDNSPPRFRLSNP